MDNEFDVAALMEEAEAKQAALDQVCTTSRGLSYHAAGKRVWEEVGFFDFIG